MLFVKWDGIFLENTCTHISNTSLFHLVKHKQHSVFKLFLFVLYSLLSLKLLYLALTNGILKVHSS
jgi:hypothetical protein